MNVVIISIYNTTNPREHFFKMADENFEVDIISSNTDLEANQPKESVLENPSADFAVLDLDKSNAEEKVIVYVFIFTLMVYFLFFRWLNQGSLSFFLFYFPIYFLSFFYYFLGFYTSLA